jgi:hypothetical protein
MLAERSGKIDIESLFDSNEVDRHVARLHANKVQPNNDRNALKVVVVLLIVAFFAGYCLKGYRDGKGRSSNKNRNFNRTAK